MIEIETETDKQVTKKINENAFKKLILNAEAKESIISVLKQQEHMNLLFEDWGGNYYGRPLKKNRAFTATYTKTRRMVQ